MRYPSYVEVPRARDEHHWITKLTTGFYELNPFPGNNQIVVSNHAFIEPIYRGKGYGQIQHIERLKKARELGYSYIICTVNKKNEAELHILQKNHWMFLSRF